MICFLKALFVVFRQCIFEGFIYGFRRYIYFKRLVILFSRLYDVRFSIEVYLVGWKYLKGVNFHTYNGCEFLEFYTVTSLGNEP